MFFKYAPVFNNDGKKYMAVGYVNGEYKRLKPYIYIDPVAFYESEAKPVYVTGDSAYEQFYVYANGKIVSIDDLLYYDEAGTVIGQE